MVKYIIAKYDYIVLPLPFWDKLNFFHLLKILKFYFLFVPYFNRIKIFTVRV